MASGDQPVDEAADETRNRGSGQGKGNRRDVGGVLQRVGEIDAVGRQEADERTGSGVIEHAADVKDFAHHDAGNGSGKSDGGTVAVIEKGRGEEPDALMRGEIVYFDTDSGGAVFAVGSITFCGSLWNPDNRGFNGPISCLLENVVRKFAGER